ncbi:MAG: DHH family phosphoesterase [Candidatus Methanomethylophilaceae archaeon]|nr:DHH family phosphoesterase [Candidatus Methanomethylophilaceae archaeon]
MSEYNLPGKLRSDLARAASAVRGAGSVRLISHIDADGITAGSIASATLDRLGIPHILSFEKKISEETIATVNGCGEDAVWICDLGSGYLSEFKRSNIIVTDHHVPDPRFRRKQTFIDDFVDIFHVNPHTYGVDGSTDICGAGMTYLLAKELDPMNADLAYLGVVGAVGDFQDGRGNGLVGMNRAVLADAIGNGDMLIETDVRFYGRGTRPLVQFLEYNSEPVIPGLSGNRAGCTEFFAGLGIPLAEKGRQRAWADLNDRERDSATEAILARANPADADRICGEVYLLPNFSSKSGLGDAKEFATVLNSCGRYDDAETGMRICKGDMSALRDAERNRTDHRRNISSALSHIRDNHLIRERRFIQYFDSGPEIRETVVGIVAGMLLGSGDLRQELPLIAFADSDDGVKVSARTTRELVDRGLNLADIMKTASEKVGGYGGGHSVAAGATIPTNRKDDFLDAVEELVGARLT